MFNGNLVKEPKCEERAVIVASKINTYAVNQEILVPPATTLMVARNGVQLGFVSNILHDKPRQVYLNKKFFEGLKKGLFSKVYKDLVFYWYHRTMDWTNLNEFIKTEKGKDGRFKGKIRYDFHGFNFEKFSKTLKEAGVTHDKDSIILAKATLVGFMADRTINLMKVILDNCPGYTFETGVTNIPKVIEIVQNDLNKAVENFGPNGIIKLEKI